MVSTFDDTVGIAAILGNQAYGPYGKKIYSAGSMGTNKGYTGQYQDATGLDYYHARYYDAVIGRFVSADSVQGNTKGMDPYDYVGGNPETATDPTGNRIDFGGGQTATINPTNHDVTFFTPSGDGSQPTINTYTPWQMTHPNPMWYLNNNHHSEWYAKPASLWKTDYHAQSSPTQSCDANCRRGRDVVAFAAFDMGLLVGGEAFEGFAILAEADIMANDSTSLASDVATCQGILSFTYTTVVATSTGEKAIGSLKPGTKVWAYNQKTKRMELEPIKHVWVNHDNDLEDLTIVSKTTAKNGKPAQDTYETIHTNKKHPFLT